MSEAYADLGGTAELKPTPPKRTTHRHTWRFLEADGLKIAVHLCARCQLRRVRTVHSDRFPTTRYVTRAGATIEGKTPPCLR
jgi:hypothetical protein